jgi:competence protein ComEC
LVAVALTAGALAVVEPLPALLSAFAALVLVRPHVSVKCILICALALGASAFRANHALDAFDSNYRAARAEFGPPQRCALWGSVLGSPTEREGRPLYSLRVERAECESGRIAAGTGVRLAGGPPAMARGDRIEAIADLAPLELLHNLDLGDPRPRAARRHVVLTGTALHATIDARGSGLPALIDRARAFVRVRIQQSFAAEATPMARALVLGENDLDPADDAAFKKSGLSHMLAVSGTHLVFAVLSLVHALRAVLVRCERLAQGRDLGRHAAFAGIVLALGYADFAGGSGSAWRAAWMLAAIFAARVCGRVACPSRALAWSLLIGWSLDPLIAFDISFLLSLAATAGLLLLGQPLSAPCDRLRSRGARFVGKSIATTLAAMIPCTPLLVLLGSELTLAGVFANVLAAPLGETIALPLCLTHALVSPWPELEQGVALVASGALLVVKQIAHESANASFLSLRLPEPNGFQLSMIATLFVALVLGPARNEASPRWRRLWCIVGALCLVLIELGVRRAGAPRGALVMTALAVGQGDSSLIDLPDGSSILVDAGGVMAGADPGERVVVPSLRARRRDHLDVVVLTHPHPDHFGGLLAVLRAVSVGEIWDTGHASPTAAGPVYAEFRREAASRGIRVVGPGELCGKPRRYGAAIVRVLAPCPGPVSGWSANDNSFVIKLELGVRALLLTGDAEHDAEARLLASNRRELEADVLKIGHHGSRTSTTEDFLEAVAPRVATISCGTRNRFGHPSPGVMARLEAAGTRALRTDRNGGIRLRTDGQHLAVEVADADAGAGM